MTHSNPQNILQQALQTKTGMDELTLLGGSLYICMDCKKVTDYWKPGMVCYACEAKGERQMEQDRDDS
jgi:hypothetical protein